MKWSDLGKIIKPAAKILGAAVPGGGIVTEILAQTFGAANTPEAIAAAIEKDPNAAAKLLEIENTHKATLERIALERDLAEIKDVGDARARDVEIRKTGQTNWRADLLALLAIAGLVTVIVLVLYRPPSENPVALTLLTTMIGNLITCVTMVYAFEFGSSRSSKHKDAVIANATSGTGSGGTGTGK